MHFYSAPQFKLLHRAAGPGKRAPVPKSAIIGVRKQSAEPVEKLDDRTLRFTISTGVVDRDLDTIAVAGWQLDAFAKNPVVLWSHRADELPVGKALDFGTDDSRLFSAVRFLPVEGYGTAGEVADIIFRMYRDGYLGATSVGFRPLEWDFSEDEQRGGSSWFPGIDFHTQELVELSLVAVPANPDALIEPGEFPDNASPVVDPAPTTGPAAQLLNYERHHRQLRGRAALVGVF